MPKKTPASIKPDKAKYPIEISVTFSAHSADELRVMVLKAAGQLASCDIPGKYGMNRRKLGARDYSATAAWEVSGNSAAAIRGSRHSISVYRLHAEGEAPVPADGSSPDVFFSCYIRELIKDPDPASRHIDVLLGRGRCVETALWRCLVGVLGLDEAMAAVDRWLSDPYYLRKAQPQAETKSSTT